ncbi:uncharacterized protein NPIL_396131 [Nephila pilipes]|uniref:Uncharacterized protein n=1 Tax=Nephila pilipes TaxID=299642 RepID=A0A8X6I5Z1_NEPPI|nr:uncharacterized protein NPIL_396131 [Nephila pilipes]
MNDAHCLKQLKDLGIVTSDAMLNEKSCLHEKNSGEINFLNGADCTGKLLTENVKHLSGGFFAVHTLLGWTVMDKTNIKAPSTNSLLLILSLHLNDLKITHLWKIDTLGINDSSEKLSKTEIQQLALRNFRETISRDSTGRYKVIYSDHMDILLYRIVKKWTKKG